MDDLFNVSFSALQDNEPIDISEVSQEDTAETAEQVEVVEDQTAEQKPEDSTAEAETKETETETPKAEAKAEAEKESGNDLIDIEMDTTSEEVSDTSEPPGQEDSSPITPFASLLQEQGFLPHAKIEDIKSTEDLIEAFRKEREAYQMDVINSFPEELIGMAEAVAKGLPFDSLKEAKVKELEYNALTEDKVSEDINLQKRLVSEYLADKGFKPEKINRYIEKYEDMGDLFDEAKDALVELKETASKKEAAIKEQYAAQQKQMEEQNKQLVASIEKQVTETAEILPGRKMSEDMRNKTLGSMLNIVGQDQNGTPMNGIMKARSENPVQFDMTIAYLMNLTNNFTDWSAINTTAKTNAAKEFEKTLSNKSNTSHVSGSPKKIDNGDNDLLDGLKMFM
jgi:cobalamin biosynthesis protein CobT